MNEIEKTTDAIKNIYYDYMAILDYVITCLNNNLDYYSYMGIYPFLCLYVVEGYDYLIKHNIIDEKHISKTDLVKLKNCRACGVKLYSDFKKTTYDSINEFNRKEYEKFFKKAFPSLKVRLWKFVDNYFICFNDGFPVGNYHLYSKKVFNMEIGTYIDDVGPRIRDLSTVLTSFSLNIVKGINPNIDVKQFGNKNLKMEFECADLNMAYNHKNFSIKDNPPILMALLDILCVLNSCLKVFSFINDNIRIGVKIKYSILFYSILSLKNIIKYSEENGIDIKFDVTFKIYINDLDKKYTRNNMRRYCMHYDFPENNWEKDPFVEEFSEFFGKDFDDVHKEISNTIEEMSNKLQKNLIVKSFSK